MNTDDRRFIRRHLPSYVAPARMANTVPTVRETLAVRHDGVIFYRPEAHRKEVWVGWLERTSEGVLQLKEKPATRLLCTYAEYQAELAARLDEARALLGEEAGLQ